ncbi:MAG: class I poly(R)-hydroxyalkanoic acid synthase, partial [Sphingobium sp.]
MTETGTTMTPPTLEDMQRWTWVIGRAQQMLLEFGIDRMQQAAAQPPPIDSLPFTGLDAITQAQSDFWSESVKLWQRFVDPTSAPAAPDPRLAKDRRFSAPQWRDNPMFDLIRQSYLLIADHLIKIVDGSDAVGPRQKEQTRFAPQGFVDAMRPSNFAFTNPLVIEK